ncbi:MAG: hypothetical protein R6U61_04325 [Thermoplasmata archaeon]
MVNYHVRVRCETCGTYERTVQVDAVDEDWVPEGHEGHEITDFVIERKGDR